MKDFKPLALLSCDANNKIFEKLDSLGFITLSLPKDERLPSPIASHADTLLFCAGDTVFCNIDYYDKANSVFDTLESYGYKIIKSQAHVADKYPNDIAFNCFTLENSIYGNINFLSKDIIYFAKKENYKLISVKQGYAKCSTVVLGNDAVISADKGITNAVQNAGKIALQTENSPSAISLIGYDYGFIGGASGVFFDTVYFTGDLNSHPDCEEIKKFCHRFNFKTLCLTEEKLCDIGGIAFFNKLS